MHTSAAFQIEAEIPKAKTNCILCPLKCTNQPEPKSKVVHLKKWVSHSGVRVLISCIFDHALHPLLNFWKRLSSDLNQIDKTVQSYLLNQD